MQQTQPQLVLLRHGQSLWNLENRFTGWVDIDLSAQGEREAHSAGELLKAQQWEFDWVCTSVLKRALQTAWILLSAMDRAWLPMTSHWRLNERHYGQLQGLNKADTAKRYGDEQVKLWRRSYSTPPPLCKSNKDLLQHPYYGNLKPEELPLGESLKDTQERVLPFWKEIIVPRLKKGERILVVAHGNSLRGLIKHLEKLSDKEIVEREVATGTPMAYYLNKELEVLKSQEL